MKPLSGLARAVMALLAGFAALSILAVLFDGFLLRRANADLAGGVLAWRGWFACVQVAAFAVCLTAFLAWFHRSYRNLHDLAIRGLEDPPSSVLAAFLVPYVNLAAPYSVTQAVWRGSAHLLRRTAGVAAARSRTMLVGGWWALVFATAFLYYLAWQQRSDRLEEPVIMVRVLFAADAVAIPAALVSRALVRRLTDLQERARAEARRRRRTWSDRDPI